MNSTQTESLPVRIFGNARPLGLLVILGLVTFAMFVASVMTGPAPVSPAEAWAAIFDHTNDPFSLIVREIRLPRAILALTIGAGLGLSGATLQGLLRNPLAEPGIIGVSSCAALGSVIAFYTGLSSAIPFALPVFGIGGALLSVVFIYTLAGRNSSTLTLILAGVAINSLAGALTALVLNLSPNPFAAYEIFFWLMGSLADRSFEHCWLALPFMLIGWVLLLLSARSLDALTLGEDTAASLGINLTVTRRLVIVGTALAVGPGVAVSGVVGFVGLIVPHLLRPLVAYRPSVLLPASALGGATLTMAADIATRSIAGGSELKLGIVTALIGAPFFFYLVVKTRSELR